MNLLKDIFKREFNHSPSEFAKTLPFYCHGVGWKAQVPSFIRKREDNEFNGYQIQYLIKGEGVMYWRGNKFTMQPGDVFFIDLSQKHMYGSGGKEESELIWVHFDGQQARNFFQMSDTNKPVYRPDDPHNIGQLFRKLVYLLDHRPLGLELTVSSIISTILTDLIVSSMSNNSHTDSIQQTYTDEIHKSLLYIEENYTKSLKLEDISNTVNLSQYHFCRLFQKFTGFTVKEYLLKYRLTQAKRLLVNTNLPLREIALQVGFTDQSHMNRIFKKIEGTTPQKYRNNFIKL